MPNCKVIALCNQKGGVGKTTTTANLGIGLAMAGKRVLLIDCDAQASLTLSLGFEKPDELPVTLADIMQNVIDDKPIPEGHGILSHYEGVDLLPSNVALSGMEVQLINTMSRENILRTYIDEVKSKYEYILIDCMPSLGMLTIYGYTTVSSAGVATAISVTDGLGNRVDHTYDSTTKLPTQQSMYVDNALKSNVTTTYNSNKLPLVVTRRVYEGSAYTETSEKSEYDSYGNLLNYWAPKDDVNSTRYTSGSKFKIAYAYDTGDTGHYSIQTSKTYYLNETTKIIEINELSTDNKHVVYSKVYENAIADANLKSKTQFLYATDAYGNMTEKRVFPDVINHPNDSIATVYSYTNNNTAELDSNYDGVFLTSQTVTGVKDADGNDIAAKTGNDPGDIDTVFMYDWIGNLISSTDAEGNITTFTYDDLNRITLQTNQDATTVGYTYNMSQNTKTVTDEGGLATLYDYDAYGNLVSVKNTADTFNIASYTYDNEFRRYEESSITTDGGSRTVYTMDDLGRVTNKQTYNGSNATLYRETYAYNDVFTLSSVQYKKVTKTVVGDTTAPSVITNTYTDKYGQLMKQSVMNGTNEYFDTFTYDYAGRKTSQKAAIAYTYASNPAYTTMWVYDYAGRVLEEYNKDGYFISNTYDSIGRLLTTTDYKGNEAATPYYTSYTYDILGRKLTETIPFTYYTDSNNNQVIAYAVNKYYYDRNGNVTKTLVKNNTPGAATDTYSKTETVYNSRGLATNVKSYEGTTVASEAVYTYNARGSILTSTVGSSVTTYVYDDHGRLYTLTDARNEVETYTYNKNNLMTSSVDRNGITTTYTYDGLGRNLTTTVTKGGITQVQATAYTASGQIATQTLTEGGTQTSSISYLYNAMGQNTRVTDSVEKSYVYDIAGNRTSFSYSGNTVTYVYDEMGRLSTVSENSTLQVTYTYDINGNQWTITNNITGIVTTNTYNLANMVSSIENNKNGIISKFSYAYRLDGNQIVKTDDVENTVTSYVYNDMGQLTAESVLSGGNTTTTSYTYDNRGNRSTKTVGTAVTTYTYDANNRLTSEALNTTPVTITEYEYDDNGNQLTKTVGGVTTTSTYDGFNFLINDGEASYSYGATGQRRQKYFAMSDTYNSINQTWDGNVIIQDNYLVIRRYVWGLNLIYMVEPDGSKTYYLYNAHGDVVQLTDEDGVVIKTYHYDAFGNEVSEAAAAEAALYGDVDGNGFVDEEDVWYIAKYSSGIQFPASFGLIAADVNGDSEIDETDLTQAINFIRGLITSFTVDTNSNGIIDEGGTTIMNTSPSHDYANPFRYCGEYFDKETNTYYLRARHYNPATGRFTQQDGWGYAGTSLGLNLYTYCSGNPILYKDPTGHSEQEYYEAYDYISFNTDLQNMLGLSWYEMFEKPMYTSECENLEAFKYYKNNKSDLFGLNGVPKSVYDAILRSDYLAGVFGEFTTEYTSNLYAAGTINGYDVYQWAYFRGETSRYMNVYTRTMSVEDWISFVAKEYGWYDNYTGEFIGYALEYLGPEAAQKYGIASLAVAGMVLSQIVPTQTADSRYIYDMISKINSNYYRSDMQAQLTIVFAIETASYCFYGKDQIQIDHHLYPQMYKTWRGVVDQIVSIFN